MTTENATGAAHFTWPEGHRAALCLTFDDARVSIRHSSFVPDVRRDLRHSELLMYRVGQKEVDAVAKVLLSGELFRYRADGQCGRFERRYARYLGVEHALLTASGTGALAAALVGVGMGPGDEVLVPACTYMATAIAVLAAGAIPVVVDIDDSITIDPKAVAAAAGRRTKAVVAVLN